MTDRIYSHFGPFLPFYSPPPPPPPQKKKKPREPNFEKMKKPPGDIIILHKCTINDDHIIYGS